MGPEAILDLQRQVGNRAVTGLLTARLPSVQRLVATKPSALDKQRSATDTLKRAVGRGPNAGYREKQKQLYGDIRRLLSDYRTQAETGATTASLQSRQLEHLNDLCAQYLTTYAKDQKGQAKVIARLQQDVLTERASLSKAEAGGIYQGNVEHGGEAGTKAAGIGTTEAGNDPAKRFGFKALGAAGQMTALDHRQGIPIPGFKGPKREERIKQLQQKYGLTDAEVSAITIYSAGDFSYINPVTANSKSWLADQKASALKGKSPEHWASLGDQTLKEEGGLHAGMAVQGLKKLKPYKGETYRGARYTPEDFETQFTPGKVTTFGALGSSSKETSIALKFCYFLASGAVADPKKSVAVLTTVVDSGGRDISGIAVSQEEAEVLILPDTSFQVVSVTKIKDPGKKYADAAETAAKEKKPLPTAFYSVRIKRIPTPSTAKEPTTRPLEPGRRQPKRSWRGATPERAAEPFAVPSAPGVLGLDRQRPDRAADPVTMDLNRAFRKMQMSHEESEHLLASLAPERDTEDQAERGSEKKL